MSNIPKLNSPSGLSNEIKVGALFLVSLSMIAAFAWYLGLLNPFSSEDELIVGYNFAGGIEVGSPVRVMGIKVGKVQSIDFDPQQKSPSGEEVKLRVKISISRKAWQSVRKDSRIYINLAGVIGEKYIEVSTGSLDQPVFSPGEFVRGEDPPRIDQLISQSYGLAGKIMQMIDKNEGSITDTLDKMNNLVKNLNKTLVMFEKVSGDKKFGSIMTNTDVLTLNLAELTTKLRGPDAQKTIELLNKLVWRLDKLDADAIRTLLQKEGIKAKLF
jgi:phospholipid/cholesterol/gamma-HCH transport system substrate-binding protein